MTRPLVSVCIANYNGETLLADCLDSVYAQHGEFDIEVLVHDDASADASLQLLGEHYPQAIVIASETNVGFCVANNRMVERARGDYVLLLNNDAALLRDAIATMLGVIQAEAGRAIVSMPQYDWQTGRLVDRGCRLDPTYFPVPIRARGDATVGYVIGACMLFAREFYLGIGGFPDWIESIGEDIHLCCQARLRGWTVRVAARSGYWHRQGASFGGGRVAGSLATTYRRRMLSDANRTLVALECTPGVLGWVLFGMVVLSLVLEGALVSLLLLDPAAWRRIYAPALAKVARELGPARARRHRVQSARVVSVPTYLRAFVWWPQKLLLLARHGRSRLANSARSPR